MFTAKVSTVQRWLPLVATVLLVIGLVAVAMLAIAGPAYRVEWLDLSQAFGLFRYAAWMGILVALLSLVLIVLAVYVKDSRRALAMGTVALLLGAVAVTIPYQWRAQAQAVPPIHDITTDTDNPPAFQDIAPLREDAPNPVEYPGEETAEQQREAYPDIDTLQLTVSKSVAVDVSVTTAQDMGWELVGVDAEEGRIEATATTRWFGFKDDVVIRIRDHDDGSELDIRSKSRVGGSDVGANAERIRQFRDRLETRLAEQG